MGKDNKKEEKQLPTELINFFNNFIFLFFNIIKFEIQFYERFIIDKYTTKNIIYSNHREQFQIGYNKIYCGITTFIPQYLKHTYVSDHHIALPFVRIGSLQFNFVPYKDEIYSCNFLNFSYSYFISNNSLRKDLGNDFFNWLNIIIYNDPQLLAIREIVAMKIEKFDKKKLHNVCKNIKYFLGLSSLEVAYHIFYERIHKATINLMW